MKAIGLLIAGVIGGAVLLDAWLSYQEQAEQQLAIDLSQAVKSLKKDYEYTGLALANERFDLVDPGDGPENKVQPGAVRWHSSMNEAIKASKFSKKPILLFELLGRLDDRFC